MKSSDSTPLRVWEGVMCLQGRHMDDADSQMLANWLYGFLRNEAASPDQAMEILLQVLWFTFHKYLCKTRTIDAFVADVGEALRKIESDELWENNPTFRLFMRP